MVAIRTPRPIRAVHCFEGSGEPLLLLHATPRGVDEYLELMPLLAQGRRAIAMDTIGYGDSYRPGTQPTIEDYAGGVVSLLDGLNIDKASIMGRHTGALIAIVPRVQVAAAHPERLDKLILYGPGSVRRRRDGSTSPRSDHKFLADFRTLTRRPPSVDSG